MLAVGALSALGLGLVALVLVSGRAMVTEQWDESRPGSSRLPPLLASPEKVGGKDGKAFEREVVAALRRSPMDGRLLFALGRAASDSGQEARADALIGQAARFSLRDSQSHTWLFDRAIEKGQYRAAFHHADALMRRSDGAAGPLLWRIGRTLNDPGARAALAEVLATNPPWRDQAINTLTRSGDPDVVAAVFVLLSETGSPPTDDELGPFFVRLVGQGSLSQARRFWPVLTHQSPRDVPPFVFNGSFSQSAGPVPLNWQTLEAPGGGASWMLEDGSGPAGELTLEHDGFSSSGPMLQEIIYLHPGSFVVRVRARLADSTADGRFRLEVGCYIGATLTVLPLRGEVGGWRNSEAQFRVPDEGCEAQWLRFTPTTIERREVARMWVDDVVISASRGIQPVAG